MEILLTIGGIILVFTMVSLATINNGIGMTFVILLFAGLLATGPLLFVERLRKNKWGYIVTVGVAVALVFLLRLVTGPNVFVALMIYITLIVLIVAVGALTYWMVKSRGLSIVLAGVLSAVMLFAVLLISSLLGSAWQSGRAIEMQRHHPGVTDLQLLQEYDDWCPIGGLPLADSLICRA